MTMKTIIVVSIFQLFTIDPPLSEAELLQVEMKLFCVELSMVPKLTE